MFGDKKELGFEKKIAHCIWGRRMLTYSKKKKKKKSELKNLKNNACIR
jgi:hypothetical protein